MFELFQDTGFQLALMGLILAIAIAAIHFEKKLRAKDAQAQAQAGIVAPEPEAVQTNKKAAGRPDFFKGLFSIGLPPALDYPGPGGKIASNPPRGADYMDRVRSKVQEAVQAAPEAPGRPKAAQPRMTLPAEAGTAWLGQLVNFPRKKGRHVFLEGETDSGKTTLAGALIKEHAARGRQYVIIDFASEPEKWGGIRAVGAGDNAEEVAETFRVLVREFKARTEAQAEGGLYSEELIICIDELNDLIDSMKGQDFQGMTAADFIKKIATRGRQIGMLLMVMGQSAQVKNLDWEGRGDLRMNFAFIRLQAKALAALKALGNARSPFVWPAQKLGERPASYEWVGQLEPISVAFIPRYKDLPLDRGGMWRTADWDWGYKKVAGTPLVPGTGFIPGSSLGLLALNSNAGGSRPEPASEPVPEPAEPVPFTRLELDNDTIAFMLKGGASRNQVASKMKGNRQKNLERIAQIAKGLGLNANSDSAGSENEEEDFQEEKEG